MLAIQLERSFDGLDGRRVGPVRGLVIERDSLSILPSELEIVRFAGEQWRNAKESFVGVTIESPFRLFAQRSGRARAKCYGRFEFLHMVGGILYGSDDYRLTLASFNRFDRDWHMFLDNANWPRILLLPGDDPWY
jgi:hypothetical protein